MEKGKKIYFVSDVHLGFPDDEQSLVREKLLVRWLDEVSRDAEEIYLMGDIFDFWFEYKQAVPAGFTRLLGKISSLTDKGLPIYYFTGNHDLWIFNYLPKETGVIIQKKPVVKYFNGKKFFLAHGDGLGPHDIGFKIIRRIFVSSFFQWLFARFHPNVGISVGKFWSRRSRYSKNNRGIGEFKGLDREYLILYAREVLKKDFFDFMIFAHRHIPLDIQLTEKTRYINIGDWLTHFSYVVFDGEKLDIMKYEAKSS